MQKMMPENEMKLLIQMIFSSNSPFIFVGKSNDFFDYFFQKIAS